jgi:hypothetical protein
MTMVESPDPLLAELVQLTAPEPAAEHSARVLERCHAVLAERGQPRAARPALTRRRRLVDGALAIAVAVYGLMTIAEALRIISRLP